MTSATSASPGTLATLQNLLSSPFYHSVCPQNVLAKTLRPSIKKWWDQGIQNIIYLDDGILGSSNKKFAALHHNLGRPGERWFRTQRGNILPLPVTKWIGFAIDIMNIHEVCVLINYEVKDSGRWK